MYWLPFRMCLGFVKKGKGGWPAGQTLVAVCPRIGHPFSLGQRFICADKLQHALQNGSGLPATSFLGAEKGGKEAPRESPLGTPGRQPAFFLGKPPHRGLLNHPLYKKGLRPRGLGRSSDYTTSAAGNGGTSDNKGGGPRLQKGRHYYGGQQSV